MRKPKLYRGEINGATYVLTPEAHKAFELIASHYNRFHSYDGMPVSLWLRVARGAFTFVHDLRYYDSKFCQKVHTAGYGLLDEAAKVFDIYPVQTKHLLVFPFASGDLEHLEEELAKGWGPKTQEFVDMIHEVRAAQAEAKFAA